MAFQDTGYFNFFLILRPSHVDSSTRCFIEGCDNETNTNFEPMWLNNTMPWNWTESKSGCQRYNQTWDDQCVAGDDLIDQRLVSCDNWLYDQDIFESTIVSDVICISLSADWIFKQNKKCVLIHLVSVDVRRRMEANLFINDVHGGNVFWGPHLIQCSRHVI